MRSGKQALVFLWTGTILFALGPAILKLLTTMGGRFGVTNPGAISFCNVLFVGNFCAGLVTLLVYGARPILEELRDLSRRTKLALLLGSVVSTVYPALIFTALERTSVINVVLLSRFNGIVFVAFAYLLFRTKVTRAEVLGYAIIATGVAVLVVEQFARTVLDVADVAAIMVHGRIERVGAPEEIEDALSSAYLGA